MNPERSFMKQVLVGFKMDFLSTKSF